MWAPRLRRLDLSACWDLRSLRLLQQEPQRYRYGSRAGGLPAAMGALALWPTPGALRVAGATASLAVAAGAPRQAAAGGSNSSSHVPPVPQPPAVWVDLSGTRVSRYTLKQLRTLPRVGPERLVPPQRHGTGRSRHGTHNYAYDSDGAVHRSGARHSHGSSGEEQDRDREPVWEPPEYEPPEWGPPEW